MKIFVFQECLKPVFVTKDGKAINAARKTLYRSLDVGLRLLSVFMPFITEELYQRLPFMQHPSICIAKYPNEESKWKDEVLNQEFELVQKIAKAIRSTRSDYNLPNKTKTEGKLINRIVCVLVLKEKYFLFFSFLEM